MGGYEGFKKDVSLLKSFYSVDKRVSKPDYEPRERETNDPDNGSIFQKVQDYLDEQTKYNFNYWEYQLGSCFACCKCCISALHIFEME